MSASKPTPRIHAVICLGLQRGGMRGTAAEIKAREMLTVYTVEELSQVRSLCRELSTAARAHIFY